MTHATPAAPANAPLTGGKVLAILVGFFGVIFAVNAWMAFDAVSTFRGEVIDNPYEAGIEYNSEIRAADAQAARAWKVDVTLAGAVRASFRDTRGEPLAGLDVSGAFAAPADRSRDRPFAMRETSPGVYVAETAAPAGVWDLTLKAARAGATQFRSVNRVTLR